MKHSTPTPTENMRQASIVALVIGAIAIMMSILLAVSGYGDGSTWSLAFPGVSLVGVAVIRLLNDRMNLS
jgi:hypothetical protein